jgi:hypothetical protein
MIIYALNIDSTVGFEYNANIVSSDAAVRTSVYEGRGYTVVFFVVGHFILAVCTEHLEFLDITLWISPGWSCLGILPFAALISRYAGG